MHVESGLPRKLKPKHKKRKQVRRACITCRNAKTGCSEERPCKRCVSLKVGHLCKDAPEKQKPCGISSSEKNKKNNFDSLTPLFSTMNTPPLLSSPFFSPGDMPPLEHSAIPQEYPTTSSIHLSPQHPSMSSHHTDNNWFPYHETRSPEHKPLTTPYMDSPDTYTNVYHHPPQQQQQQQIEHNQRPVTRSLPQPRQFLCPPQNLNYHIQQNHQVHVQHQPHIQSPQRGYFSTLQPPTTYHQNSYPSYPTHEENYHQQPIRQHVPRRQGSGQDSPIGTRYSHTV